MLRSAPAQHTCPAEPPTQSIHSQCLMREAPGAGRRRGLSDALHLKHEPLQLRICRRKHLLSQPALGAACQAAVRIDALRARVPQCSGEVKRLSPASRLPTTPFLTAFMLFQLLTSPPPCGMGQTTGQRGTAALRPAKQLWGSHE